LTLDPPIQAVYSSPYYRCLQTITPFVDLKRSKHGVQRDAAGKDCGATTIHPEHGLSEWYGSADFDHPSPAAPETLKGFFPFYDETYESAVVPSTKGESIVQLHDRVAAGMSVVVERCDAAGTRAIILCTHAAVVIALGRVLTGIMPEDIEVEDFRAFTCGLSVYRRKETLGQNRPATTSDTWGFEWRDGQGVRGGWTCEANSDCSFLSGGEERGWLVIIAMFPTGFFWFLSLGGSNLLFGRIVPTNDAK
jgi:transcription factor C subunit 7